MNYTITSPLYYVNDKAHLGSTYTTIACDALARFKRLEGNHVIFITGVDEHGQKIERTAEKLNIDPIEHCNKISDAYIKLWSDMDITYDSFIRTTSNKHQAIVNEFFKRVQISGDIYLGKQQGWYCVGCEEYKDLQKIPNSYDCSLHKTKLEWRDEENLFFRLSRYQKEIEELVNRDDFIYPIKRKNEIKNFVSNGLKDFSISRIDVNWGLTVPDYKDHTLYVWFDALVGYLSSLILDSNDTNIDSIEDLGWPASIHVIGKDILRFHAIYWPAMLISAGLPLPKKIYGHGFLTREGQKMGKSLGNVIDPSDLLSQYGSDSIRWYLLKDIHFGNDGDYQHSRFIDLVNNDLANTIGNLLNRTMSMSKKWFDNKIPSKPLLTKDCLLKTESLKTISKVRNDMSQLNFSSAATSILELAVKANIYINDNQPWKKIKDQECYREVSTVIYSVLETCRIIAILLAPIVPNLSNKMLSQLGRSIPIIWEGELSWALLKEGTELAISEPIFEKIEESD